MRAWILALVLVALPASALDVILDGDNVGELQKLTVTQNEVTVTTEQDNEPEPTPDPEPAPDPEPSPGAGCSASDVICSHWEWPDGESHTPVTIPKATTLSYQFRTTSNKDLRGAVQFEARSDTMPNTDIWISKKANGPVYAEGTYNSFYCQQRDNAFMYSLRWYQKDSSRGCSLDTQEVYYFNIRHSSDSTPKSYTYRWRTYNE